MSQGSMVLFFPWCQSEPWWYTQTACKSMYFFICWITLHLLKFQSATIRRKKKQKNYWCTCQPQWSSLLCFWQLFKKVWDMLTRQLRPWYFLFVGLGFFASAGLHVTGWVYLVYFSISPVHSLMFVMSIYCLFFHIIIFKYFYTN